MTTSSGDYLEQGVVPKVDPNKAPVPGEIGTALAYSDSLFSDYLDPAMGSISWWDARDTATMLRTDGQARKTEQVLTLPLLGAPRRFVPAKGDKGECEALTAALTTPAGAGGMSTPLGTVIAQMTTAVSYRVASFEKVWKAVPDPSRPGGTAWTYDKLAFRPASNTRVSRDRRTGGYRGIIQDPPVGGSEPVKIDATRAFTYTHGVHRAPILGSSDMEIPLVCWKAKQKLRFLWFLFLELHAQPRTAFTDTREGLGDAKGPREAARLWTKLRGGGAVALPPGVTGDVLETSGHAADLYKAALDYLDSEMTGQVLAQFSDLAGAANSGTGSFAMSRDQSDFYMLTRRRVADEMAEQFTEYVNAPWVRYNFGPDAAVPTLKIGPLVTPDLSAMLTALAQFQTATPMPAEFVAFLVEQTSIALGMPVDQVARIVKATTAAHEAAATSEAAAKVAPVVGAVDAAANLARKAQAQQGGARARAAAAPAV